MRQTPLEINVGAEKHAIPTVEGCLEDNSFKFYSAQNAIRVHEWIRDTSTDTLVLEAVKTKEPGLVEHFHLGNKAVAVYPELTTPWQLLRVEQDGIAAAKIRDTMAKNIEYVKENPTERNVERLAETSQRLKEKVNSIWAFNASNMFFGTPIPERFIFQTMETLNILFSIIITQRDKVVYNTSMTWEWDIPYGLFRETDLQIVLAGIHQAGLSGFFHEPYGMAKVNNLLNVSFYKQCAMAISACCGIKIPRDYIEERPTQVYFWASKLLNKTLDSIEDLEIRHNTQNVVNLFQKA
jgi:hypothetical protein